MRRTPSRRFYGWRIAGLAMLIGALTGPGQTIGVSVFIDHFERDLDISRSAIAACYLVGTLSAATALPRWGRAIDRIGVRRATTVIGVAFSISLVAMAGVTGVATLTIGFLLIRMLGQGALALASVVAVGLWFERRRGVVQGMVVMVSGALMALVPVGLNQIIEQWGWRSAWLASAGVIAAVVVPIGWFGLVDRPSAVGQFVDGQPPDPTLFVDGDDLTNWGFDRAAAMRTRAFWTLALASGCVSFLVTALNFHQIALLGEAGLSSGEAAAMFVPQAVGAAAAGVVAGALVDRLGTRLLPATVMAFMALTLILAGATDGNRSVIVYAAVLGATTGLSLSVVTTVIPAWFGTAHLGSVSGVFGVIGVAASAVGPVALSLTADVAGGWQTASVWWLLMPGSIGVVSMGIRPPHRYASQTAPTDASR